MDAIKRPLLGTVLCCALIGLLVFVSSCDQNPRQKLLSREHLVFLCQHPAAKTTVPAELASNASSVDVIIPMWFDIKSDGSVVSIHKDSDYATYREFCKKNGITLLPILRNFKPKDFLLNPEAISRAVGELGALLKRENFDGFTIDIEEDSTDDRTHQPMLSFLEQAYAEVKKQDKFLCVTFNPVYWGRGWQNEEILQHCDWAFSMFYDYAGPWNKTRVTATAPYEWPSQPRDMKRDIAKIISERSAGKIIFGMPAYGNDCAFDAEGNCVEMTVSYVNSFLALQAQENAPRLWDAEARTPYFEYQRDGKRHRVWYEDAESYQWRTALATKLKCAGIGVWSVGSKDGMDPALWASIKNYRQGKACTQAP